MKKLVFALAVLFVAVLAAAVASPWLVDAGQYRTEIASRASALVGGDVTIDGPVTFNLLPSPRVRASDVRVAAPEAGAPVSIEAKRVELALGWGALFGRTVEINRLRVIEPRVTVAASATRVPQLGRLAALRIERTDIENGRIVWRDPAAQTPRTIEQFQATILASPLASSVRISGTAVASAVPVEFDAVIGDAPAGRPNPVSVNLGVRPGLARLTLRGAYDADAGALRGRLQIEGDDFYTAAATIDHIPQPLAGVASQAFSARGELNWTSAGVAANDVALQLGELRATGAVNATFGRALAVDVALAMTVVDLDRLARLERGAAVPAPSGRSVTRAVPVDTNRTDSTPPAIDIALDLGIDAVGLNNGTLRQVRLNAVLSRDDLVINQASALLPGETEFTGFAQIALGAATPRIDGTLNARSDNLRGLLEWLGLETSGVPAGRLRRFEGQARIEGTPSRVELTGISLAFDSTRATGAIAVALGSRVGLGADLRVDQLNLDGYALADRKVDRPSGPPLLERFDANLTFAAQTLTWGGEPFNDVSLDALLQGGDLVLRSAVVADVVGTRAEARGKISAVARQPEADLDVALRTDDASRLLRLVDLSALTPNPLALGAKLYVGANGEARLENLDLAYGDSRIVGRAAFAGTPRRLAVDLAAGRLFVHSLPRLATADGAAIGVDATLKADTLFWGGQEVTAARIEAHVDPGAPPSIDMTGVLFDGALDFTARPESPGSGKLSASLALRGADLRRGLSALFGTTAISGRADVRAAISAPARMGAEIWSGLSGSIELAGRDGTLTGIDLPLMRDMLARNDPPTDIVGLLGAGLRGGATPFTTLNATARIEQGRLAIETLRIATPAGEATGSGGGDLGRGTVDLSLTVPVAGDGVPPVQLKVQGPVDEARVQLDFSRLQRYLSQRQAETPGPEGESQ